VEAQQLPMLVFSVFKFLETNLMPTTITSAGITFNDATTLTSATIPANAVGATQIANGSVTAAKLGTDEQKQIAKAWLNFNGAVIQSINAGSGNTISCNSGATTGTWTASGWAASDVGTIYKITQIGGVAVATFGGVDVSTLGIQIISFVAGVSATFRFLSGTTTSAQSVTGTGSSASGFSFISTGIRSSYNVSSVTKNATGNYTVNFTTPMSDSNYTVSHSSAPLNITNQNYFATRVDSYANSSFRVLTPTAGGTTLADYEMVSLAIFGN
jgi:hypothetical protein